MFYHDGTYMIYFAPMKYYNDKGQFSIYKLLEDSISGELSATELHQIEVNLRVFRPKEYRRMMKALWRDSFEM